MTRPLAFALAAFAVSLVAVVAHAGEDPVLGVVTGTGTGVSCGCVTVPEADVLAFQCLGCRVRYRLVTDSQYAIGFPVPTDGGALLDGGSWGALVDFTVNADPYKTKSRVGQTRVCFFAEDAGVGADGGYASRSNRVEVFGSH